MERQPWPEAVYLSTVAQVVRLHADEDAVARQDLLPQLRRVYGAELIEAHGTVGAVWMLHMALAAVWADEPELAERHVAQIERLSATPRWPRWGTLWLRGLVAEARGRTHDARVLLESATSVPVHDLPLYRAHLAADLARVARAVGDARAAEQSLRSAIEQYRRLGAVPYVERLSRSTTLTPATGIPSVAELEALTMLSDRERDVVTLLVAGLSYAQIARDLYVTRSTVGFHLTNIYAKTGVSSRHDLTDLVRGAH
jgi:ATP/maltotriose-dependent transcriptional regulator MalT